MPFASSSKVLAKLAELERPLDTAEDRRWPEPRPVPVGPAWEVGELSPAFMPIGTQFASDGEAQV